MPFPNFDKGPKKVILQKVHDDKKLILSLLLELLYTVTKFRIMADLMKTPGHADPLQGKNQEHVEKITPWGVFLFLSPPFEGIDILAGLMENLLEP